MADDTGKDDVDDTADDTEEDEYTPPTQEDWERTQARLAKLNEGEKKWRLRAQGKDPKWTPAPPAKDEDDDTEEEPAKPRRRQPRINEEQIRRDAEEAALAKAKPGLVRSAAKDALRSAGLIVPEKGADQAFARAIRLIDLGEVDVDEDGSVSGVEDQVKAVKRDYPELFAKRGASRVNAGAGSNRDDAGQKPDTSANKLAAILQGR